jgi:serine/threonine protein kinase
MTHDTKCVFTGIRINVSLQDGQSFADGRFRVIRKIGSGNATVYLVHDNQNGEQYALKVIGNMFELEIELKALEKLHGLDGVVHPISTLAINFWGISVNGYFMPYFRNGTLKEYATIHEFHKKTPENRRKLIRILRKLATILKECHARGVFHCDIKPENILMDDDENPVFADFGISEILLDQSTWFGLTKEELATRWWRDPYNWKAFRSNKGIMYRFSVLSDLWSLVLTIFAIFFGEHYNECQLFNVFREGFYNYPKSQLWIDEAIDSVIDRSFVDRSFVDRSDESFRSFFKRWLNIESFDASNQRNPTDVDYTQVVIDSFIENVDEI